MIKVTAWFERQAARSQRAVSLEEALIGGRFWPYAVFRLRYFFVQYLAAVAVHSARVVLLYTTFASPVFLKLLVAHAVATLFTNFWWGGLETMRSDIRRLRRTSRADQVRPVIERWMVLAAVVSGVLMVGGAAATVAVPLANPAERAYVFALVLRVALSCLTQTFHSGVYAIRRVYRPAAAIAGLEMLGLGLAVVLRGVFGPAGLPAALILSTLISAGCNAYYVGRVYRFLGLQLFQRARHRRGDMPQRVWSTEFIAAGSSFAMSRLDAFLVLALFAAPTIADTHATLPVMFGLLSPTVRAGFDWARLFYFDLKRLDLTVYNRLLAPFDARLRRLAVLLGGLLWIIAVVTVSVALPSALRADVWLLLPFFVARSLLASIEVGAFSARRYRLLLASGCACLAGLVAVRATVATAEMQLLLLSALLLVTALVLGRCRPGTASPQYGEVEWLSHWLADLAETREPVRVASLRMVSEQRVRNPRSDGRQIRQAFAEQIARRLGDSGSVALIGRRQIVWYERGSTRTTNTWVATAGGGLVERLRDTGEQCDGVAAIGAALRLRLLPAWNGGAERPRGGSIPSDIASLVHWLRRRAPSAVLFQPDLRRASALASVSRTDTKRILRDALRFAREMRHVGRGSSFEVSSVCVRGELRIVIAVPRFPHSRPRLRWRKLMKAVNVQVALANASSNGLREAALRPWQRRRRGESAQIGPRRPPTRDTGSATSVLGQ